MPRDQASEVADKYFGLHMGRVVDNADPDNMGRVKALVPSIGGEVDFFWAFPLGTAGGGKQGQGLIAVPEVESIVGVMFLNGDENLPCYLGGWWPAPDRISQAPAPPATTSDTSRTPIGAQDAANPENRVWETRKWRLWFRDAAGEQRVRIESKDDASQFIEIDGNTGDITISVSTSKQLLLGDTSATEQLILGNAFATIYNAHVHPAGALLDSLGGAVTGLTAAPTVGIATAQLSSKVKAAT